MSISQWRLSAHPFPRLILAFSLSFSPAPCNPRKHHQGPYTHFRLVAKVDIFSCNPRPSRTGTQALKGLLAVMWECPAPFQVHWTQSPVPVDWTTGFSSRYRPARSMAGRKDPQHTVEKLGNPS